MANIQKYTRAATGHIFAHVERKKDEHGEYVRFSNQSIDPERTHLNYNLHTGTCRDNYDKRMSQVKCMKRDDVNVLASIVLHIPRTADGECKVDPDNYRLFFESAYQALSEKVGRENVLAAEVHRDEVTDHMHFLWMPIVKAHKKTRKGKEYDIEKVCFDEAVPRLFYQQLHPFLEDALKKAEQKHGIYLGSNEIQNGTVELNGGNLTVQQLKALESKREQLEQQLEQEYQENVKPLKIEAAKARSEARAARQETQKAAESLQAVKNELDQRQVEVSAAKNELHKLLMSCVEQQKQYEQNVEVLAEQNQEIQDLEEYNQEVKSAWTSLDDFRKAMKKTFSSIWPFRNRKKEQELLETVEHTRDAVYGITVRLVGFELRERIDPRKRASKAITRALDELIVDARGVLDAKEPERLKGPEKGDMER